MQQLLFLVLFMLGTSLFGAELIHDAGNENGELKSTWRYQGNSQLSCPSVHNLQPTRK